MSIATNDSLLQGTRGKLGNLITRRVNGKTVISRVPKSDRPQTAAQIKNRRQFREASAFATAAIQDPGIAAHFKHEAEKRQLPNSYTAALSSRLNDLKASAKLKDQTSDTLGVIGLSSGIQNQQIDDVTHHEQVKQFRQLYNVILDPLEDALAKVSLVWRNVEALQIDNIQKELLLTAVRSQIQRTLLSIHARSRAHAIEFKTAAPNFEHIKAPGKGPE